MHKYFLAILPPDQISSEIISFQKEIESHYGSVHAQKTPPHITVIPPFTCEPEKLSEFIGSLAVFLKDKLTNGIIVELSSFQRFENRTLFVDVAKNEAFERFCKRLKLFFNQQRIVKQRIEKHFFVPHITIANKDIKKRDFNAAWKSFKTREYQRVFNLKTLVVLKLEENKWVVLHEVKF